MMKINIRRVSFVLIISILASIACISPISGLAAEVYTNVATVPGVTASDTLSGSGQLNDGLFGTSSSTDPNVLYANPTWVSTNTSSSNLATGTYDLGANYQVDKVVLYSGTTKIWSTNLISGFTVETASDASFTNPVTLGTYTNAEGIQPNIGAEVSFTRQPLRYIRFVLDTCVNTSGWLYVTEFEIWGYVESSASDPEITVQANAGGTVSPNGAASGGKVGVVSGEDQTFVITPNTGYYIKSVKYNGVEEESLKNQTEERTFTVTNVTEDGTLNVEFAEIGSNVCDITVIANAGGTVSPNGENTDGKVSVFIGNNQSFVITPDLGYLIKSVTYNGVEDVSFRDQRIAKTFVAENVSTAGTLQVVFDEIAVNSPDNYLNLAIQPGVSSIGSGSTLHYLNDGNKFVESYTQTHSVPGPTTTANIKYFGYDFGDFKEFNNVVLYEFVGGIKIEDYELQYSMDGTTYHTITKVSGIGTNGGTAVINFNTVKGRYVRFAITKASAYVYISEMEVYNKNNVVVPEQSNLLVGRVNNVAQTAGNDAEKAFVCDNDSRTSWTSGTNAGSITITLNEPVSFNRISIDSLHSENMGNVSVEIGNPGSLTEVYYDNLMLDDKNVLFGTPVTASCIKVSFSNLQGSVGITEIGLYNDNDTTFRNQYISDTISYIGSYINSQLAGSNSANLPIVNGSVFTSSNTAFANVSGNTLVLNGGNQSTITYLSSNMKFGEGVYETVNIPIVSNLTPDSGIQIEGSSIVGEFWPIINYNFTDIENTWAKDYIIALTKLNIISGRSREIFAPEDNITRAEFVKLLVETFGLYDEYAVSKYVDVSQNDWYYAYVSSLESKGLCGNVWVEKFYPNEYITREDMAYLTFNALKVKGLQESNGTANFEDYGNVSEYAKKAVTSLYQSGIINGYNNMFHPKDNLTRAEASKIIYILYSNY